MPGILDLYSNPANAGALSLAGGLLEASGPSLMPVSFGQALGRGVQQGAAGYQQALRGRQSQQLVDAEAAKTDLLKLQLAQAKAQFDLQKSILSRLGVAGAGGAPTTTPPGMSPSTSSLLFGSPEFATPAAAPQGAAPSARPNFPFNPTDLAALRIAGLPDLTGAYNAAQPDTMAVDAGNETLLVDKRNPSNVLSRVPKKAAPGSIPYEGQDIPPSDFRNFLLDRARASSTQVNVNSQLPASEAAQKDFMDKTSKNYEALRTAPVMIQNIAKARDLAKSGNPFVGSFGEQKASIAQFFNNNFGTAIAPDQVADAGELKNRLFQGIMENLKKMDASPSEMQQKVMMEALGSLNTDPGALDRVLSVTDEIVRGKVALHNKEVESAVKRGVKFPYDPVIQMPELGGGPQKSFPAPSTAAINRLKMNPRERNQFESVFGPGSAAKYLGK